VSGQIHAPADLSLAAWSRCPLDRDLGELHSRSARSGEEREPQPGMEHLSFSPYPVFVWAWIPDVSHFQLFFSLKVCFSQLPVRL